MDVDVSIALIELLIMYSNRLIFNFTNFVIQIF